MENWRLEQEAWWRSVEEDELELDDMGASLVAQANLIIEDHMNMKKRGGSRPGRKPNLPRDRSSGAARIFADYFSDTPVYNEKLFRRKFRMSRKLFLRIQDAIVVRDPYFEQRTDAIGIPGLSTIQKTTAAVGMLAYGVATDTTNDYCKIAYSTATEAMKRYCAAVIVIFGPEYLRPPRKEDIRRQLAISEGQGFRGMFASLDCMHWVWKNCPSASHGMVEEKNDNRSIILEAVADQSLRIWHAYFGVPGSNNDMNVINRSPLISSLLSEEAFATPYTLNGNSYEKCYLLADEMYPKLACFVQTIHEPVGEKQEWFAKMQETARKDVQRCFGVLLARFAMVRNPCRLWDQETIRNVMHACIILHNMIIEDEAVDPTLNQTYLFEGAQLQTLYRNMNFEDLMRDTKEMEDSTAHDGLQNDLVEHLWLLSGNP